MLIILLAYLGGILTILSPCILPVLPFVFARADRSFVRSTLPLLAGMAGTFAIVATLAAVGGGWAIRANADRPLGGADPARAVRHRAGLPGRLRPDDAAAGRARLAAVRAPAGREGKRLVVGRARSRDRPAVGAVRGPDPRHHLHRRRASGRERRHDAAAARLCARRRDLARARACWSAASVFARMKKSLGASERIRQVLGVLVLVGVAAIALGPRHAGAVETFERADREPRNPASPASSGRARR